MINNGRPTGRDRSGGDRARPVEPCGRAHMRYPPRETRSRGIPSLRGVQAGTPHARRHRRRPHTTGVPGRPEIYTTSTYTVARADCAGDRREGGCQDVHPVTVNRPQPQPALLQPTLQSPWVAPPRQRPTRERRPRPNERRQRPNERHQYCNERRRERGEPRTASRTARAPVQSRPVHTAATRSV